MKVDRQQLLDDGYIIIRECVPSDRLDELRDSFEVLVDRQRQIWAREREPDDPPGGLWETHRQPRVSFDEVVDRETANTVEFCLHENTLGVSEQLVAGPEVGIHQLQLMCNPVGEHPGGTGWHRDTGADFDVPLEGIQGDMLANGPGHVQWNIPLYDDNVLWVVPGSHRRPNTEVEDRQLREDRLSPPPGAIAVELAAGDGVVYLNHMLHSGSSYTPKLRRTIHLGYQNFGGPMLRYFHLWWDMGFTKDLPGELREVFERWESAIGHRHDLIESVYRAMLERDTDGFHAALNGLHSDNEWKMACVILLCKVLKRIPETEDNWSKNHYLYEDVARRFTTEELDEIWDRFGPLDSRLQADAEEVRQDAQGGTSRYRNYEMPTGFDVEDFVKSWSAQHVPNP